MESAVVSRIKYLMGLNNQEKMKIYDKIALKAQGWGVNGGEVSVLVTLLSSEKISN